jgi:hypothetical protein
MNLRVACRNAKARTDQRLFRGKLGDQRIICRHSKVGVNNERPMRQRILDSA